MTVPAKDVHLSSLGSNTQMGTEQVGKEKQHIHHSDSRNVKLQMLLCLESS